MSSSDMHRGSTSSSRSNSAVKSALKAASRRIQEHHQSVNAAFGAYYSYPPTPSASAPATRRPSAESTSSVGKTHIASPALGATEKSPSTLSKALKKLKEHNKGVNNAYAAYYGVS
jgi:hypothetical protein